MVLFAMSQQGWTGAFGSSSFILPTLCQKVNRDKTSDILKAW